NHGVVVTGTDLVDAVDNTEELEETAKLYFLLKGQQVRYLTDDEVKDLEKRGK
ncbi:putative aldolase, partial [Pasteurella multocida subsp. multocida str. Anand1_cattle]